MSNKLELEETLSALMDDEADDLELRRVLKAIPEHKDLQEKWSSFHLLSAVIKQEAHSPAPVNLLSGIQAQLEKDSLHSIKKKEATLSFTNSSLFKTVSQSAIAASVALAVLFTANTLNSSNSNSLNSLELAELSEQELDVFVTPVFNGEYTASEFSRMASFGVLEDETDTNAQIEHLRQAVYKELEDTTKESQIKLDPVSE